LREVHPQVSKDAEMWPEWLVLPAANQQPNPEAGVIDR
jgi:hypothetical protein